MAAWSVEESSDEQFGWPGASFCPVKPETSIREDQRSPPDQVPDPPPYFLVVSSPRRTHIPFGGAFFSPPLLGSLSLHTMKLLMTL